jgi:hypothetical protein
MLMRIDEGVERLLDALEEDDGETEEDEDA